MEMTKLIHSGTSVNIPIKRHHQGNGIILRIHGLHYLSNCFFLNVAIIYKIPPVYRISIGIGLNDGKSHFQNDFSKDKIEFVIVSTCNALGHDVGIERNGPAAFTPEGVNDGLSINKKANDQDYSP